MIFPAKVSLPRVETGALGGKASVVFPLQRRQSMSTVAVKRKMTAMERKGSQGGFGR